MYFKFFVIDWICERLTPKKLSKAFKGPNIERLYPKNTPYFTVGSGVLRLVYFFLFFFSKNKFFITFTNNFYQDHRISLQKSEESHKN